MEIATFEVGDCVQIKGGEEGVIIDIQRPLGFMISEIKTASGSIVKRRKHEITKLHGALQHHRAPVPECFLPNEVLQDLLNDDFFKSPIAPKKRKFEEVKDADIEQFINNNANTNTAKKTRCDISTLQQFISTMHPEAPDHIEEMEPEQLNTIICKFLISARKKDGSEYEPTTMKSYFQSFSRYLRMKNYKHDIYSHVAFSQARLTLTAKQKSLKAKGRGNAPNRAECLNDEEIDRLYTEGQMGQHHPEAIINGLWWANTTHFGLRGTTAHHAMRWGDVSLQKDAYDNEFLSFNERSTKTRTGADAGAARDVTPCAWATPANKARCPVELYRVYARRRPAGFSKQNDPFYISTTTVKNPEPTDTWFKKQPIGRNKIGAILKKMAEKCGLNKAKKITNHSARKTLIQNLVSKDVPPTHIMQISGHKSMQSLNTYSSITQNQHREISHIISGGASSKPATITHSQDLTPSTDTPALPITSDTEKIMKSFFSGPLNNCNITVNLNIHKNAETTHSVNVSQQNNLV